jgi:LysR family transcriptional regulator of abg operon
VKLNQLEALIAIADGQGIAGAAKKLNISQPAITKSLSNLEHDLGVDLLDRSEYRLKLTPFGEKLLPRARAISSEITMAYRDIQLLKETGQEVIRLNGSPGVMPRLIPQVMQRVRKTLPGFSIGFFGEVSAVDEKKFTDLAEGVYDLLIYPVEKTDNLEGFKYEPVMDVKLVVMASKGHPAIKLEKPSLNDLIQYDWLMPAKAGIPVRLIDNAFLDACKRLPQKKLGLPVRQMLFTFLNTGEYLAFVPYHPSIMEDESADLPILNVDMPPIGWTLYTIQRASSAPSVVMDLFLATLKDTIKESL